MSNIIEVTDDTFSGALMSNAKAAVLFHAPWSGHSQLMHPIMESVAEDSTVTVCFAQAELNTSFIAKFGIRTVPTLALFENGKLQGVRIGRQTREDVLSFLESSSQE